MANKRIAWADTARALTMLLVIIGHIVPKGEIYTFVYSFHVPAFFFLSGLFFSAKESFPKFVLKKFKSIMVPYYIFGIIAIAAYLLLGRFATEKDLLSLPQCLWGLLAGSVKTDCFSFNFHLWFLPALFSMSMFMYPISRIINFINRKKGVSVKSLAIIFTAIFFLLSQLVFSFGLYNFLPLSADTAFRLFPFFIAGYAAAKFKKFMYPAKKKAAKTVLYAILAGLFTVGTAVLALFNEYATYDKFAVNYVRDNYGNRFLFWSAAICGVVAIVFISKLIPEIKAITYTGQKTLAILVMQKFPIMLFNPVIPLTATLINKSNPLAIAAVSVATALLCLGANFFIEKFLPFMYGKGYKQK